MIPFDELSRALENFRKRRQGEAPFDGGATEPTPNSATPIEPMREEHTGEIDADQVIED